MDKNYELIARDNHKSGMNCSNAIYNTFVNDYNLTSKVLAPRSIEEKCGAVIETEQILKELNLENKIKIYENKFIEEFGSLKCIELMKKDRRCNDYIGMSSKFISDLLK